MNPKATGNITHRKHHVHASRVLVVGASQDHVNAPVRRVTAESGCAGADMAHMPQRTKSQRMTYTSQSTSHSTSHSTSQRGVID
ncbi:TPA: hypothetical protein HA265_04860 [Candidatus Woesearchaeota archaeon]|nr:hypothetical protein [Candidatus Woesearchaeota archaeon]